MTTFNPADYATLSTEYGRFKPTQVAHAFALMGGAELNLAEATRAAQAATKQGIQSLVDIVTLACDVPKATFKASPEGVEWVADVTAYFEGIVTDGLMTRKAAANAKTSFWIAFGLGIPFQSDLVNDYSAKTLERKDAQEQPAKAVSAKAPSKAVTMTAKTRDAALREALRQLRGTGLTELAADVLDMVVDTIEGFKE
jgi:hypothetical protein